MTPPPPQHPNCKSIIGELVITEGMGKFKSDLLGFKVVHSLNIPADEVLLVSGDSAVLVKNLDTGSLFANGEKLFMHYLELVSRLYSIGDEPEMIVVPSEEYDLLRTYLYSTQKSLLLGDISMIAGVPLYSDDVLVEADTTLGRALLHPKHKFLAYYHFPAEDVIDGNVSPATQAQKLLKDDLHPYHYIVLGVSQSAFNAHKMVSVTLHGRLASKGALHVL